MLKQTQAPHSPVPAELATADEVNDAAVLHFRARRYDAAAELLERFLSAGQGSDVGRLRCRVTLAVVERARGNVADALRIHLEDRRAIERCPDLALRGKAHSGLGATYILLRDPRAVAEYTTAAYYHRKVGELRLLAEAENNLAFMAWQSGKLVEARDYIDHAMRLIEGCASLGENVEAVRAQFEDTRSLIETAEGNPRGALRDAASSIVRLLTLDEETAHFSSISVDTLVAATRTFSQAQEAERLRAALVASDWNVTQAAHRLGYKTRQALANHLRRRFPDLDRERRRQRNR